MVQKMEFIHYNKMDEIILKKKMEELLSTVVDKEWRGKWDYSIVRMKNLQMILEFDDLSICQLIHVEDNQVQFIDVRNLLHLICTYCENRSYAEGNLLNMEGNDLVQKALATACRSYANEL